VAKRYVLKIVTALALSAALSGANGQTLPAPQFGIVPNGSYESYHVDTVNMDTGNDIIKIPLFSLPQLGKLSLSFSIVANATMWEPEAICASDIPSCYYAFTIASPVYGGNTYFVGPAVGPAIVPDNFPTVSPTQYKSALICPRYGRSTPQCSNYYSEFWTVYDSTGGSHAMYYDSRDSDLSKFPNLRTTDGSGFLYQSGLDDASKLWSKFSGTAVLIDSHGVQNQWKYQYGSTGAPVIQTDPDGNKITTTYVAASPFYGGMQYADTVGRVVLPMEQATSSTTGCPNLPGAYQPAVSSSKWQVPGPNNTTSTYLICNTSIYVRTNFFGCGQSCGFVSGQNEDYNDVWSSYNEDYAIYNAIQSIVLPDGTYWGFVYDAADPNNSSDIGHYATLSRLIFPEGGSIAYSYTALEGPGGCNLIPGYGPMVLTARQVSDANGHTYLPWQYLIGNGSAYGNESIDPNQNSTTYQYSWPSPSVWGCGHDLETSRTTSLRSVNTTYQITPAPLASDADSDTDDVSYGNALPTAVTTTLDPGISTTTTTGYDTSSITAIMPSCFEFFDFDNSQYECGAPISSDAPVPVTLSLSIPTSTSITDYSSSVISNNTIKYAWQDSPYSYYFITNELDAPDVVNTFNGASRVFSVAQTATTLDERAYLGTPGAAPGHPTTVFRPDVEGSVVTHTAWTAKGMVDHTVDANGNTDAQYTYGPSPCSSAYLTPPPPLTNPPPPPPNFQGLYPTAITNALGQTTQYTWDCNTGQVASVTDPNNVTTNYFYNDPRGRLTQIQSAVGTPAERWTTYSYPSKTEIDVAQDQSNKGDQILHWSAIVDGLGRQIQQNLPNGSEVRTTYDGMDQVVSKSNPFFPLTDSPVYTYFSYDALGRMTKQTAPDGSQRTWTYSGNATTATDEAGNATTSYTDALGRLTKVVEPGGLTTLYTYDALNNLTGVSQLGNGADAPRVRSFTYDSLSRLLCASNPENSTAACPATATSIYTPGTTGYSYDFNGNVLSKTDARSVTTNYTYDWLNRVLTKTYSNAPAGSNASCYQYDTSSNGIGHMAAEWTAASCSGTSPASGSQTSRVFTAYDPAGRLLSEQQCTLGHCTASIPSSCPNAVSGQTYCYDLAGNLTWYAAGVPNIPTLGTAGLSFTQLFDTANQLSGVGSSWMDATHPMALFIADTANGYTAAGALQNATFGKSLSPTPPTILLNKTYDNRLRVTGEMVYHP
jgi:YD repeat-containing protein